MLMTLLSDRGDRGAPGAWPETILRRPAAAVVARIVLTFPFWASGLAKLVDFSGGMAEMAHFGFDPPWAFNAATILVQLGGSLLIIANNGDAEPIAYQRDFSLEVGPQQTSTIQPTVTVHDKQTPVVNITSTAFETITQTAAASTITSGRGTQTITPKPTTITNTRGFFTVTQRTQTWDVIASTKTVAASCSIKPIRHVKDPLASIVPTVLGNDLQNIVENIIHGQKSLIGGLISSVFHPFGKSRFNAAFHFKRELAAGRSPSEELKQAFVAERAANLKRQASLNKRAPDDRTKTVTADTPSTSTISEVGAATTQTITTTQQTTVTSTPPPVTAGPVTVTGKQVTKTRNINIPVVGAQSLMSPPLPGPTR